MGKKKKKRFRWDIRKRSYFELWIRFCSPVLLAIAGLGGGGPLLRTVPLFLAAGAFFSLWGDSSGYAGDGET